jgi:hypothetical protein
MTLEYPDVMNDVTDARLRFESGVVQYLAEFSWTQIAAGGVAELVLTLQNITDAPVNVAVHLELPRLTNRLKRLPQPLFEIFEPDVQLMLENGEVGQLSVPVYVCPHVPEGEYVFGIQVRSRSAAQVVRCRAERSDDRMGDIKLRHPQGLGIAPIASWGYETEKKQQQDITLVVGPAQAPAEDVDIKPQFHQVWTPQSWELIPPARQEVNARRAYLISDLVAEAVFVAFMRETQSVFSGVGVELHVGEAISIAKMLTWTVSYLMAGNESWQDCLLVPIFAYANANGQSTTDVVWIVTNLGYMHVLELAIALGFVVVEEALKRPMWDPAEQRAVREYIVRCLDSGASLPLEFVYLPLVLGGIAVAREVAFAQEDVLADLRLLAGAKAEKAELLADPELNELHNAFDRLLAKQAR